MILYNYKNGWNIFYRTLIHDKNYNNWDNARISLEPMISKTIGSDYCINDGKWSECIENTLKIKDNKNLKEFKILDLRNNLYFNLKVNKIQGDCTQRGG